MQTPVKRRTGLTGIRQHSETGILTEQIQKIMNRTKKSIAFATRRMVSGTEAAETDFNSLAK